MKKTTSLILTIILLAYSLLALPSCFLPKDDASVRIGVLAGPTGMGMAKLMNTVVGYEAFAL